jgi:hypothetical protein
MLIVTIEENDLNPEDVKSSFQMKIVTDYTIHMVFDKTLTWFVRVRLVLRWNEGFNRMMKRMQNCIVRGVFLNNSIEFH